MPFYIRLSCTYRVVCPTSGFVSIEIHSKEMKTKSILIFISIHFIWTTAWKRIIEFKDGFKLLLQSMIPKCLKFYIIFQVLFLVVYVLKLFLLLLWGGLLWQVFLIFSSLRTLAKVWSRTKQEGMIKIPSNIIDEIAFIIFITSKILSFRKRFSQF